MAQFTADAAKPRYLGSHWGIVGAEVTRRQCQTTRRSRHLAPNFKSKTRNPKIDAIDRRWGFDKMDFIGVFVYRLGHGPLKAERRVRFPYALPVSG